MHDELLYPDELHMTSLRGPLTGIAVVAALLMMGANSVTVTSQATGELQPRFNRVLAIIHQAEASGATPDEVKELAALLNQALELNEEALRLTGPEDAERRAEVLTQLDQLLSSLEIKAGQLETVASQRASMNKMLAYISGGIGAFFATLAYAFAASFWRRYRIKRTFQMRIHPK